MEIHYLVGYGQHSPVWYLKHSPKNFRNYFKNWWPENKSPLLLPMNFRFHRFKKRFMYPSAQEMGFAHRDLIITYTSRKEALLECRTCPGFEIFVNKVTVYKLIIYLGRHCTVISSFIIFQDQRLLSYRNRIFPSQHSSCKSSSSDRIDRSITENNVFILWKIVMRFLGQRFPVTKLRAELDFYWWGHLLSSLLILKKLQDL